MHAKRNNANTLSSLTTFFEDSLILAVGILSTSIPTIIGLYLTKFRLFPRLQYVARLRAFSSWGACTSLRFRPINYLQSLERRRNERFSRRFCWEIGTDRFLMYEKWNILEIESQRVEKRTSHFFLIQRTFVEDIIQFWMANYETHIFVGRFPGEKPVSQKKWHCSCHSTAVVLKPETMIGRTD